MGSLNIGTVLQFLPTLRWDSFSWTCWSVNLRDKEHIITGFYSHFITCVSFQILNLMSKSSTTLCVAQDWPILFFPLTIEDNPGLFYHSIRPFDIASKRGSLAFIWSYVRVHEMILFTVCLRPQEIKWVSVSFVDARTGIAHAYIFGFWSSRKFRGLDWPNLR